MQISKIQQSPNFGMALNTKAATSYLSRQPKKFVKKIEEASKELLNTKSYDLVMAPNGKRTIVSKYGREYLCDSLNVNKPIGKLIFVKIDKMNSKSQDIITASPLKFDLLTPKAAKESYEKLTSSDRLERDVELTKLLDRSLSDEIDNLLLKRSERIKTQTTTTTASSYITIDMH